MKRLDYLLERLQNNLCSQDELNELKVLLKEDELIQNYFEQEFESIIEEDNSIPPLSEKTWSAIEKEINSKTIVSNKKILRKRIIGVAASIALLLNLFFLWKSNRNTSEWISIKNTTALAKKITLPDHSSVWLASQSILEYPSEFGASKRETKLKGKAFFEVTKNKKKPFTIRSGEVLTTVLGTSFNINTIDSLVEVSVATGAVRVAAKDKFIDVIPNQEVIYNSNSKSLIKRETLTALYTMWIHNEAIIDSVSMNQFSKYLEKTYKMPVFFKDENAKLKKLYSLRLNTKDSLQTIIKRINYINEVQLKTHKNMIEITSK